MTIPHDPIRHMADYQKNWAALIPPMRRGKFIVKGITQLSIHGDAPKFLVCSNEYTGPGQRSRKQGKWPTFIAKVGSKWYPIESITEHLITRVGQLFNVRIADSQLRLVGRQVRFLSKYFLRRGTESLVHGIEIFRDFVLDEHMVEQIAAEKCEQEFYTFQTVVEAVKIAFPADWPEILNGLVEMLAFDALVGNNDRHPANWGVIVSVSKKARSRFAPVFDTARGLFWNFTEDRVRRTLQDRTLLDTYVRNSRPQIGWDGADTLSHLDLIAHIARDNPAYIPRFQEFLGRTDSNDCARMIEGEFNKLLSEERRRLIVNCLALRHESLRRIVADAAESVGGAKC